MASVADSAYRADWPKLVQLSAFSCFHPSMGAITPTMSNNEDTADSSQAEASTSPSIRRLFSVPAPIKRVFDTFPLITYGANPLPLPHQTFASPSENRLFVFTNRQGAKRGAPSFNPQCLKWQVSELGKETQIYLLLLTPFISLLSRPISSL